MSDNTLNLAALGREEDRGAARVEATSQHVADPFANLTAGKLFGEGLSAESGSEIFNKVVKVLNERIKETPNSGFQIFEFPREKFTDLSLSVIAVVRNLKKLENQPQHKFVTYQLLILEATGDIPKTFDVSNNNGRNTYKVSITAENANNPFLNRIVKDVIQASFQQELRDVEVHYIDPVVVPKTFNVDNAEAIKKILSESSTALNTRTWARLPNFKDLNIVQMMASTDVKLPVSVEFPLNDSLTNSVGLPIHVDAYVETSVEKVAQGRQQVVLNSPQASRLLFRTGALIDLVPVNPEALDDNRARRGRKVEALAAWAPRAVVTDLQQYLARTGAGVFFAVASLAELSRGRVWAQSFRGRRGQRGDVNLRDLGNLNIEANLMDEDGDFGHPIKTDGADFDEAAMRKLLDATIAPGMVFAVDCPTTGTQAFQFTPLYNIARGRQDERGRARNEVMNSLLDATNGLIRNHINLDQIEILEGPGELIHTGTWMDANNQMRDLRELDNYLAIAGRVGTGNAKALGDWIDSYYDDSVDEERRMANRLDILQAAAAGTVTVTGTALRVTVNPDLLDAFNRALDDGKVPLVSRDNGATDHFNAQRRVARGADRRYRGQGFGRGTVYSGSTRSSTPYSPRY